MSRSRNWCLTLNNWTQQEYDVLLAVDCRYLVVGKEVGASGTPHLQGYVVFAAAKTLSACKRSLGVDRVHLERAKGNAFQNFEYCSKDGDFVQLGSRPLTQAEKGEEEKQRWKRARVAAETGCIEDVPDDIFIRHYSALKKIQKDYMKDAEDLQDVCGVWYYGVPGAGKSFGARQDFPNAYKKMCNKWWDGYQGQEYVLIDDLDTRHECLGHHLKIWADRYAYIGENKGGAFSMRPKKIIVTSNYSIETIFGSDEQLCAALKRRFTVKHFTQVYRAED